jgi:pimeloyl-ACP methyl ester carboxylesterase
MERQARRVKTTQTPIAQRSRRKVFFDHKDMDYYFSWILGRQIYGGSDSGECFDVAARITNGDPGSWQREWVTLAKRVEAHAESARQHGDVEEAYSAYLRTCTYYRAPLFLMRPGDPAFHDYCLKMRWCFQQAAALSTPPIEVFTVPFQGHQLLGYFWKGDTDGQPRPTFIVIGGIETFAEDCYFMIGPAEPQHGYHVLTVDLPGQGVNPNDGLFFEARMGPAVRAVLNFATTRADVDQSRLAVFGFSWGGHVVFKGAHDDQQHERRIKALIANPAMPDVFRAARAQQANHGRGDPISRIVIEQIAWRMGLNISLHPRDLARRLAKAYDYLMFGKVRPSEIHAPVLCLAGAGEARITLDVARACIGQLPHPLKSWSSLLRRKEAKLIVKSTTWRFPTRSSLIGWMTCFVDWIQVHRDSHVLRCVRRCNHHQAR